eukprot:416233-Pyramimonas_sp.AAC.1
MSLREGEAMVDEHTLRGRPLDVHFSGADLTDGHFQFEFQEVAGYFRLPHKIVAADYEVKRAHDDDLDRWVDVDGHESLWACAKVIPMGWSWSLFFCHSALTDVQVVAEMT